ncbi:FKBP-type peptidyl-prolyl cis-trans isomerase [Acinetobacter sp. ANC 4635]|uniref:FKBP-type peptidyl-prolyl cis-trans isomerase n=1 Tax=Acinetobacter sp. ANC 4635 TaxID=2529846 RepID=UPI001039AF0E|nr:FKBP-type peptidyl-prolyl cis-trans isomerase [Acinetobacter sp. ANC 4635]TCB29621.1 FKBP-type peptidyl-prolyl cis-trans isomerase [Acinetobacter sp. ANC 4635]
MSKALPVAVAVILGGAALVPVFYASQHPAPAKTHRASASTSSEPKKVLSYMQGYQMGGQVSPEMDIDGFAQGLRDAREHKPHAYNDQQVKEAIVNYQKELQGKLSSLQEKNKTFLTENAKKAGVKTTASGLQYEIIKQGTGKQATANSTVKVNYEGKLVNGTVFDSSYARGEPAEFPLAGTIPGWIEGIPLLKEGGSIMLYVPAKLAYGEQGNQAIPPNSVLIFKVDLLAVK